MRASAPKFTLCLSAFACLAMLAWVVSGQPEPRIIAFPPREISVPAQGVTVPMSDLDGRPLVGLRIHGKGPYRFILDTGAEMTVVATDLRDELSLPYRAGARANLDGNSIPLLLVDSIAMGDVRLAGITAFPMPLANLMKMEEPPRGVLSAMSFPGQVVTFDFPNRRLTIRPGSIPAGSPNTFEYAPDRVVPVIPVRIGENVIRVPVDTGASSGLTLPNRYLEILPIRSRSKGEKPIRTAAGEFPVTLATVGAPVSIASHPLPPELQFSDTRGSSREPQGTIGSAILRDFVVSLDAANHRIRLTR